MISEALLVPFVLWCAYSPITTELRSVKGDFALEPLPCTQRYETRAGCLKAQTRVDPTWAPQCLPLTEVQTRDRLDQLRLDNAPPAYRPEPVAHLLWCDTKVVIGCNQYYKDSDACYAQWLKTPNIVEPRCLPAAPNEGQSDFGSPARIPEAVKVFFERHPDSIDAQHQRLPGKRGDPEPPLGSRPTGYGVPETGPGKQSVSEPLPLQFMIQLGIFSNRSRSTRYVSTYKSADAALGAQSATDHSPDRSWRERHFLSSQCGTSLEQGGSCDGLQKNSPSRPEAMQCCDG
jgi:hypothetical protein